MKYEYYITYRYSYIKESEQGEGFAKSFADIDYKLNNKKNFLRLEEGLSENFIRKHPELSSVEVYILYTEKLNKE